MKRYCIIIIDISNTFSFCYAKLKEYILISIFLEIKINIHLFLNCKLSNVDLLI